LEVIARIKESLVHAWRVCVDLLFRSLNEAAFRVEVAFKVLTSRMPLETELKPWLYSVYAPVLIDVHDWSTDRLLFSVLVWPPLDPDSKDDVAAHEERVVQVKEVILRGVAEIWLGQRIWLQTTASGGTASVSAG
jgi:hypothetical protein